MHRIKVDISATAIVTAELQLVLEAVNPFPHSQKFELLQYALSTQELFPDEPHVVFGEMRSMQELESSKWVSLHLQVVMHTALSSPHWTDALQLPPTVILSLQTVLFSL